MSLVIGLTGSIASGKSTVANLITELNMPVIDADKIARELVYPGEEAYEQIVREFGAGILLADQSIDRKKLGKLIFTNESKRARLDAIMHPKISMKMIEERDAYLAAGEKCIVLDIPLLFENKLTTLVNKILVVYVDEKAQLTRLIERDALTRGEAKQRIASQMAVQAKKQLADAVIDNNGSLAETSNQLADILKKWHMIA